MQQRAWVLDDEFADATALKVSLQEVGYKTTSENSIASLEEPVLAVANGEEPPPDIVVIDQNWNILNKNLEILGREDITINSTRFAGIAIAEYIRSFQNFSLTELVMTSGYEEGISVDTKKLSPVRIIPKNEIKTFGHRLKSEILRESNPDDEENYLSGALIYIKALVEEIGLSDLDMVRIVGGRGDSTKTMSLDSLLRASRDSRSRLDIVLRVFSLFREGYGPILPDICIIEKDFGESIRTILLEGDFISLLRLKERLEDRAGGSLG